MGDNISTNTRKRIPLYLDYLNKIDKEGQKTISSGAIATALGLGEVQVRKDLASISSHGKPKIGYDVLSLIHDLENYLGYRDLDTAVIFGVGKLGMALLDYPGFNDCGFDIVRGFDIDARKFGLSETGKPISDNRDFVEFNREHGVSIAILCVPESHAQEVSDFAVQNGIRAILNFAPIHLNVPDGVVVKSENLAYSLALLSIELKSKK